MLQVITNADEINKCQQQLHKRLAALLKDKGIYSIGYQGGNFENEVYSGSQIWFSTFTLTEGNQRYWNAFGTELVRHGSNSIVVEINIPLHGINRRVSGVFAKDPTTKDTFLLHRGRVGGGKKGIGKDTFTEWYCGERTEIDQGDGSIDTAILVTALATPSFLENLTFFVQKVAHFKRLMVTGREKPGPDVANSIKTVSYRPEFVGIKKGKRPSSFVAECNHGRIVDALESLLRKKYQSGLVSFFNNRSIDLGTIENGKVTSIYDVAFPVPEAIFVFRASI